MSSMPLGRSRWIVLRRHGVHWPPNIAHLRAVAGGRRRRHPGDRQRRRRAFPSLCGPPARAPAARQDPPSPARCPPTASFDTARCALLQWVRRRSWLSLPWLQPDAAREVERRFAANSMRISRSWPEELANALSGRHLEAARGMAGAMAHDAGVDLVEPFFDPRYVLAVAADSPREGYGSRTAAMERYFGDLLPSEVVGRSTKAVFTEVFCGAATRRFAEKWAGRGSIRRLSTSRRCARSGSRRCPTSAPSFRFRPPGWRLPRRLAVTSRIPSIASSVELQSGGRRDPPHRSVE